MAHEVMKFWGKEDLKEKGEAATSGKWVELRPGTYQEDKWYYFKKGNRGTVRVGYFTSTLHGSSRFFMIRDFKGFHLYSWDNFTNIVMSKEPIPAPPK